MKFSSLLVLVLLMLGCTVNQNTRTDYVVSMHFLGYYSDNALEELAVQIDSLADIGVNTCILEVDYHYSYDSHPELRQGNDPISADGAREFSKAVKDAGMQLFIEFQVLGHQSWAKETYPLLTVYPELDLTPGEFPDNEGLYCREWDPTNPRVNQIIFSLLDELIDGFQPCGIHVGMDEVFLLGSEKSPSTYGMDPAELYAQVVNEYYDHIVGKHNLEMMMWGDRLIDASQYSYGEWEAAANGTAPAIDMISRDIIICDWHYELRDDYPSLKMFTDNGFRVIATSWRNVEASDAFFKQALSINDPNIVGIGMTAWGRYRDPVHYSTLLRALEIIRSANLPTAK